MTQILEAVRKKVDKFDQIKVKTVYTAEKKNTRKVKRQMTDWGKNLQLMS